MAGLSLFLIGKYNALVKARGRLVTETLMLDFLVRRNLHLFLAENRSTSISWTEVHDMESLALRGAVNPVSAHGAPLVMEAALHLRHLVGQSEQAHMVTSDLEQRIASCRESVLAYNSLLKSGVPAGVARVCGFFPVPWTSPIGQ